MVTAPPILTAAAQDGKGTRGRVKRRWPGRPRCPKRISIATLTAMITKPSRKKNVSERAHGSLPRQLATTKQATPQISSNRNGFGFSDCIATTARQIAHSHHANECNERVGRRVILRGAVDANATRPTRRGAGLLRPPR